MTDDKEQKTFDIDRAIPLIRRAIAPFPAAAMFALADEGYNSPFEQLIACIISIRTYDEVSLPVSRRLFALARTPEQINCLSPEDIDRVIRDCTYHERKAEQIYAIASQLMANYDGVLPCDANVMMAFDGVGSKCAHLALGIACGQPYISVDTHVHRVTNRWGYVKTNSPVKTLAALETKLPRDYWVEINRLLVPFGKHICTGQRPRCSFCPVLDMCQQVGVENRRQETGDRRQ